MAVSYSWGAVAHPPHKIFVLSLVEATHAIFDEGCISVCGVSNLGLEYGLPRFVARDALESCWLQCRLGDFSKIPPRQCQDLALCHPQVLPPLIRENVDGRWPS